MYQCMRHAVLLHHTRRNLYFVSWFTCSCLSIDICSNSNISTSDVAHKHGLTRSLFIEVPVPCKDSERSLMEVNSTMVSVLVSTAVDCEFDLRSGQGNDYEIGICFFFVTEKEHRLVGSKSGYCVRVSPRIVVSVS